MGRSRIMAKFVFNDGKVFSGGYDLSSHITNVNLELTAEEVGHFYNLVVLQKN